MERAGPPYARSRLDSLRRGSQSAKDIEQRGVGIHLEIEVDETMHQIPVHASMLVSAIAPLMSFGQSPSFAWI